MPKVSVCWDDEHIEMLSALWGQGLTAAEIAERMGGISRNAVLGKAHRLGLAGRRVRQRNVRMPSKERRRPRQPMRATLPLCLPLLPQPEPPSLGLSVLDLTGTTCRWAHGDPKADFQGFCGQKTVPGSSYCAHHHRRAHQ
jgi:GcrA cell cycle regulator